MIKNEPCCSNCKYWKIGDELSGQITNIEFLSIRTDRGLCNNKAMHACVNSFVDDVEYQSACMEFDLNYWPESWDGIKRGTPLELFRWQTTQDFYCNLHERTNQQLNK